MLSHCFVTRDPTGFATRLSTHTGLCKGLVTTAVEDSKALHEETHLALEYLSELACRAMVCHRLNLNEDQFTQLLIHLCDVSPQRDRLTTALRHAGFPTLFWEDIVVHAGRKAA